MPVSRAAAVVLCVGFAWAACSSDEQNTDNSTGAGDDAAESSAPANTSGGAGASEKGGSTGQSGSSGRGGSTAAGGAGVSSGGAAAAMGGKGGTNAGGTGGAAGGPASADGGVASGGDVILFDDFLGSTLDTAKWTAFDRIGDQANGEIDCCLSANVSVAGGNLRGLSKHEDHSCGDSLMSPVTEHYTSWQIQQKTAPFLYGTVEVRARLPGGTGIWPAIWMLGFEWQASQPATANTPNHNWPHDGWCEIDIAEFWQNARSKVNNTVHFNVPGGLHEAPLPDDASTRYMVYRLQWTQGSLIWSVDAEDGAGYRTLRTVTGAGSVPDVPMYLVINAAIGGSGGGTPDAPTFPQTFLVDWVRITR
jgi:beta-glucanase (GH16 family)